MLIQGCCLDQGMQDVSILVVWLEYVVVLVLTWVVLHHSGCAAKHARHWV